MHRMHLAWINDKSSSTKKAAYARARSRAQTKLRDMKDQWWKAKSVKLQAAANRHDLKAFYQALKTVYGPRETGSIPVRSIDGSLLTDNVKIRECWAEHFQILNQHSDFDTSVMDELPQCQRQVTLTRSQHQRRFSVLSVRCRLVRPQAPTESPLMSSTMEARICYDTCLICSLRHGLKRVCHRTSRMHLSCTPTSVKETELSATITEAYLCYQSLGKLLHASC